MQRLKKRFKSVREKYNAFMDRAVEEVESKLDQRLGNGVSKVDLFDYNELFITEVAAAKRKVIKEMRKDHRVRIANKLLELLASALKELKAVEDSKIYDSIKKSSYIFISKLLEMDEAAIRFTNPTRAADVIEALSELNLDAQERKKLFNTFLSHSSSDVRLMAEFYLCPQEDMEWM